MEDLIPSGSRLEVLEQSNGYLSLRAGQTSDFSFLANIMFIRVEADWGSWFFVLFCFVLKPTNLGELDTGEWYKSR